VPLFFYVLTINIFVKNKSILQYLPAPVKNNESSMMKYVMENSIPLLSTIKLSLDVSHS
jgi:hypothetical protein